MKNNFKLILFGILLFGLIAADRISKVIAKSQLENKGVYSYIHDTVRFVYVENTGAFLSFGDDLPKLVGYALFILMPLIILTILAIYIVRKRESLDTLIFVSLVLILCGGLGNIIDRIFYDMHVSDFINFGIGELRTGILNLADVYVTFGAIILVIFSKRVFPKKEEDNVII